VQGIKHLLQCHCILPQYRNRKDPVFHRFTAFSVIDDDDNVVPRFTQCNNCGVIHKIIDICKSEVARGVDESSAIITIQDLKRSLTPDLISILTAHDCDIATWEHVNFIYENKMWSSYTILSRETIEGSAQVKILTILDDKRIKIESQILNDNSLGEFKLK
jgi:hypothetical protein